MARTSDWRLLLRLAPFMAPHTKLLVAALVLMPLTAAAAVAQPYLKKLAIDAAIAEHSMEALMHVVVLFAAVLAGEFVVRFAQVYVMQLAGQRTMADLRMHIYRHIQRVSLRYFDRTPIGRTVTRVSNDVDSLGEFFASGAVTAITDIVMLAGIAGAMLWLDWQLSLVVLAALPPLLIVVNMFRRYARRAFRDIRARIAQLNAYMAEQVNGVEVVQAFGRERRCADEYRYLNREYRDANHRAIRYDALLYSVVESISVASVALMLWFASVKAGILEEDSAVYVGTVVAFYDYIQLFFVPIRDLSTKYTIIQSSLASAERIFGLLDVDELDAPSVDRGGDQSSTPTRGPVSISFRDVTFGYHDEHPVLHHISFDVAQGETVALVGATGSGKTTLTALLLRLYELQQGRIELGGRDIREMTRGGLRGSFAVVPQGVFLFAGTLLENVALGDPEPDEARALRVLQEVGASQLVASRVGGIRARVDERGTNFSLGERQLVAFARALYRDPAMLILDEATSNVDSETEMSVQAAVRKLVSGRTSMVIAHRLSTIRDADRVLVLHRGRLVEQGTHDDLLAAGGVYARLHRLQFAQPFAPSSPAGE